ncbi:MAG: hypothetical protein O2890_12055 [Cyanobacteria bacterium]|nr:hypothetical protein [Cyanobacteriota bacterium]MDA0867125.1 hypothetical protein [Cyanobacteriota bacterium]
MVKSPVSRKILQWSALPFVAAGLMVAGVGPIAIEAAQANDYDTCVGDLLPLALDRETVAAACALAYRPQEVSSCVTGVIAATTLDPRNALSACSRDRRPLEVSTCVTDIHTTLTVSDSLSVLDHCHRSLLPVRYSQCVLSLGTLAEFTTADALDRCISAGYRPENVAPTYIPAE